MKVIYLFLALIFFFTCDRIDKELANQCNPAFIFKEDIKKQVNFNMVADNIFQPYCSPCHSTSTYELNLNSRVGYIPLDDQMKLRLGDNQSFLALFEKYIDHDNPENSILVQAIKEGDVTRADYGDYIRLREPRFRCFLPDDYVDGLIWWIENADGNTANLF